MSIFETLASIDVKGKTEKKGKFTYLSWAHAIAELSKHYPEADIEVVQWTQHSAEGAVIGTLPVQYFPDGTTMVTVNVTIDNVLRCSQLPVMNNYNKPIECPNSFEINTAIQRCTAKAIALHGLGLNVYVGEDLPILADNSKEFEELKGIIESEDCLEYAIFMQTYRETDLLRDIMSQYLEPFAASKQKTKEGNRLREMEKQGHILLDESAAEVVRLVMEGDLDAAEEITREYDKVGHKMLGSRMPEDVKQRLIEHYKEAA